MESIRCFRNPGSAGPGSSTAQYGVEKARRVRAFHAGFPEYRRTPLVRLDALARELGAAQILVKDESFRFGLNAFKVLGGSWALGRVIAERLGCAPDELPYERLVSAETRAALGELTFITATDGNHGRGVAWSAQRLGQRCVVYMPHGSARERLENIRALGADASITDLCYDDAVRLAARHARERGWVLVQDTAWPGYETVPRWIMEGYTTMGLEIAEQLSDTVPTHLFLQAGVGSMAGAIAAFFAELYGTQRPRIAVVEPLKADCFYRTAAAHDGRLHAVTEEMDTMMAGLACGEPSPLAWEILRDHADAFVAIPDAVAAEGMHTLGRPLPGDTPVVSGESGASTLGLAVELMRRKEHAPLREALGLDGDSRILCISTEGDTDKANYRRIVWGE